MIRQPGCAEFLSHQVPPAFPTGLTVNDAYGHMQHSSGEIIKQKTKVVVLVHKNSKADDAAINKIITIKGICKLTPIRMFIRDKIISPIVL